MITHSDVIASVKQYANHICQDIEHVQPEIARNAFEEIQSVADYLVMQRYRDEIALVEASLCQVPDTSNHEA